MKLADRLQGVSESATLKLNALVQTLKAQGKDIVNLTAGEPDFAPPEPVKDAAIAAVKANKNKYTPVPGIPELRELIVKKTHLDQLEVAKTAPWSISEVLVTSGAKQALYNFFQALLNPGDEVIIPAPYWLSYPEMVKLAGGVPKIVQTDIADGFKIKPEQLEKAITPRTRAFVMNSPSNPTGAMYTQAEMEALGKMISQAPTAEPVWVASDEIYDKIVFGSVPFCSFLKAAPFLRNQTITFNGLSKSAAITGWRIGWSVAPKEITQAMGTIQGQSSSGICSLTQWAGVAALGLTEEFFTSQMLVYKKKRDLALEFLKKSAKLKIRTPDGAFYLFVGVDACLKKGEDSFGFAERLLQDAGVASVPGTPFGAPNYLRLSFATDEASIRKGCERLVGFAESK